MTARRIACYCCLICVGVLVGCKARREYAAAPVPAAPPAIAPAVVVPVVADVAPVPPTAPRNLLRDGVFAYGLSNWLYWMDGARIADSVQVITGGVRLLNPAGKMVGIRQTIAVDSGTIYRLCGSARSLVTNDSTIGFGARLAFFLPPQKELDMVWMSEYDRWWPKDMVFTNQVTGVATIYAHLGFGGFATTGEFTDIRLEEVPLDQR